jgi:molybdopterin-guanine dinucleotide biosynthesis protein A
MLGIVLSGGQNTRFPYLKGFIEVEGKTIIERNVELLRSVAEEVVISANEPEHYFRLGLPLIGDVVESGGPMSGIYSALRCTAADRALVVACDMPFIKQELIGYITSVTAGDAVMPVFDGKPQPLPAAYSSSALGTMEEMLMSGNRSLIGLIDKIDVKFIDEDSVRRIDPEGLSFININTDEDLQRVLKKP